MALLLFDGDFIKLKCIKQEISLRTIRALFHKKNPSFTAMKLNPDSGDTLSLLEQIKFLPSTSAYWHYMYTSSGSVLFKRPDEKTSGEKTLVEHFQKRSKNTLALQR